MERLELHPEGAERLRSLDLISAPARFDHAAVLPQRPASVISLLPDPARGKQFCLLFAID
jgi:hypothetical protein